MSKTIIAGSRHLYDYDQLLRLIGQYREGGGTITEVVCGCAPGVDTMGKIWALENEIPVKMFPADWKTHGRAAGPIRNRQMAEYADALLLLWDGKSRGSANMLQEAEKRDLTIHDLIVE